MWLIRKSWSNPIRASRFSLVSSINNTSSKYQIQVTSKWLWVTITVVLGLFINVWSKVLDMRAALLKYLDSVEDRLQSYVENKNKTTKKPSYQLPVFYEKNDFQFFNHSGNQRRDLLFIDSEMRQLAKLLF